MAPKDNAPEPDRDDWVKRCRGQIIKASTEGGNKGINTIVAYQRGAFLHNGVIQLCRDWIVHGLEADDADTVSKKLRVDRDMIDDLGTDQILARGETITGGELVGPTKVRKRESPDPREETFQEQDFDGIGEQMRWLSEEADQAEQRPKDVDSGQQSSFSEYSDAGVELAEDVEGQTEWSDWAPDSG